MLKFTLCLEIRDISERYKSVCLKKDSVNGVFGNKYLICTFKNILDAILTYNYWRGLIISKNFSRLDKLRSSQKQKNKFVSIGNFFNVNL